MMDEKSSLKSPRTPKKTSSPKKTLNKSSSNRKVLSKGNSRTNVVNASSTYTPEGWENKRNYLVYQKPKDENQRIAKVGDRHQGVWTKGYVVTQNPQEVWVYELGEEPPDLALSDGNSSTKPKHIHGVWGYKPGGDPDDPNDVWFYPPNYNPKYNGSDAKRLPSYFTQRGIWTFPLIKRDASEIAPDATGWLGLGETAKIEKLDVAGTWKMLYKQGANLDDSPKGPGMKASTPKSAKSSSPTGKKKKKKLLDHIRITVEKPDGKPISLKVLPTDTINDIKGKIEDKEGIPKNDQRLLSPNGELLDNPEATLKICNIQNGDTLRLEGMRVRVQNSSGDNDADDVFMIDNLTPDTTVADLKKRIEDQEGMDSDDQLLAYHEKLLNNTKTLKDYGIENDDILDLQPMIVKVQEKSSRKGEPQSYTLGNGAVTPSTTILEVKRLLEERFHLPPSKYQRLSYDGVPLDKHDNTLKDYGVSHRESLDLEPMHIYVKTLDGASLELEVNPTDTIEEVKQQIEDQDGVPVSQQRLLFDEKTVEDSKTIMDYGIQHEDTLDLGGMVINVQHFNGNILKLDVTPTNTLMDVKGMIERTEGTPLNEQFLFMRSKQLKDDHRDLSSYKIKHGSALTMEEMKIFIQTPSGKFPLKVTPTTDIDQLKQMIEKKTSITPKNQQIRFNGSEIDGNDNATIEDCGIQHRDTLVVEVGTSKDDPTYMVQISDYRDAFTYTPSPKKNKSPRGGRKIARNKASTLGGTSFGNYLQGAKMTDTDAVRWTHSTP